MQSYWGRTTIVKISFLFDCLSGGMWSMLDYYAYIDL
jgi:hypothetical protein